MRKRLYHLILRAIFSTYYLWVKVFRIDNVLEEDLEIWVVQFVENSVGALSVEDCVVLLRD